MLSRPQLLLRNEIEAVDFQNGEKARDTINDWVELKTSKKIRSVSATFKWLFRISICQISTGRIP
jgi:serine protease inhibitor